MSKLNILKIVFFIIFFLYHLMILIMVSNTDFAFELVMKNINDLESLFMKFRVGAILGLILYFIKLIFFIKNKTKKK